MINLSDLTNPETIKKLMEIRRVYDFTLYLDEKYEQEIKMEKLKGTDKNEAYIRQLQDNSRKNRVWRLQLDSQRVLNIEIDEQGN